MMMSTAADPSPLVQGLGFYFLVACRAKLDIKTIFADVDCVGFVETAPSILAISITVVDQQTLWNLESTVPLANPTLFVKMQERMGSGFRRQPLTQPAT